MGAVPVLAEGEGEVGRGAEGEAAEVEAGGGDLEVRLGSDAGERDGEGQGGERRWRR